MKLKHLVLAVMSVSILIVGTLASKAASNAKAQKSGAHASATKTKKPAAQSRKVASSSKSGTSTRKAKSTPVSTRATPAKPLDTDFDTVGNPQLSSSAFVVQDVNSGEILLEKNAHAAVPIASITKLMTVMVVLDAQQSLSEVLEITNDDVDRLKGTSSRLTLGTRLSREELMLLALMSSENRAASSLARHYPGGMTAFLEAVKVKARLMGLADTHIYDGTGLNKDNVSSARDLATLVANASRYPLIREFSTREEYIVRVGAKRTLTYRNTNSLVSSPDWQIDVSKTGYISESGRCLVMQAWLGDKPLAIVLLDSWGRYTRVADAQRIRKWLENVAAHKPSPLVFEDQLATTLAN
ncbi:MAG: hypothetical protein BSR46_06860 [Candidatus Dactylopiibacterium carminicum]|uniref:D-alanyl-D-alanine endopeptidase n=1 Tax=Candidatus Dactylopiibacterium carminicum TaxID=857335 RepID=UPI000BC6610E|nr:D-alanyl-D-alanine endopeptidase [Candidatus Dactylopiibacterium carminicum]PAS99675.1 MAG: hypothetical protein BSR46_06860 [Candidatus Dactylopiibacterium carminicum]